VARSRFLRGGLGVYFVLFMLFLYGPFAIMAILSFQTEDGGPQFPLRGVSTYWYEHLLGLAPASRTAPLPIGESLVRSLILALMTMITSTVLGVLTAQAFRGGLRRSGFPFYLVVLGMIVPGLLIGLGVSLVTDYLGVTRSWWGTGFVVHVVYTFPFCFLVMLAVFNRFDRSLEEASASLGVDELTTFRKVTFPLIFPGVLTSLLIAFTLSYDEFPRTLFASGADQTLPLTIYGTFGIEIHPNIFVFGVLTTLFSCALLGVYALLMVVTLRRRAGHRPGQEAIE
jgi:putative spermidine/putrescine transport system permease protein